jgi:hypothetical protein
VGRRSWVEEQATNSMRILQRIAASRSVEIPLLSEYRTMKSNILGKCAHRMHRIYQVAVSCPEEMFPINWKMKTMKLVFVNLVEVVTGMLFDKFLIGTYIKNDVNTPL